MKFPYNLSTLRLTLLSKEDLITYKYEHSPFYPYLEKVEAVNAYKNRYNQYMNAINEDAEYNDLTEIEKQDMGKALTQMEANMILNEVNACVRPYIIEAGITSEEFDCIYNVVEKLLNDFVDNSISGTLNENQPGPDMGAWIGGLNLGWIGRLSLGILSTGVAGIVGLFVAGKDKFAAKALEKYMNKLVELTDSGVFKKKSIFSFFGLGKNKGDQSQACFRSFQEVAERQIAKDVLITAKAAGLVQGDGLQSALNGTIDGGLTIFSDKISNQVDTYIKTSTTPTAK